MCVWKRSAKRMKEARIIHALISFEVVEKMKGFREVVVYVVHVISF